jgi:HAD superfamily hydrolase (TIGR01509 family)
LTAQHRALICDLDGTLADTLPGLVAVYERFVTSLNGVPSADEFARLNGLVIADVVRTLCRTHGCDARPDDLVQRYEDAIDRNYQSAPARPGARELLEAAQANGWKCAVVTSGRRDRAGRWLTGAGLDGVVDTLVTGDDVSRGKPDPEAYVLALERLRAEPATSIAVGDSEAGAAAALGAGMRTYYLAVDGARVPPGVIAIGGLVDVKLDDG